MDRDILIIPENKKVIEKIKEKYNNPQMNDKVAQTINNLEIASDVLKKATTIVGIAAVLDWIIVDPVLGMDEIMLTALVPLLKQANTFVNNKIYELSKYEKANMKIDEITQFISELTDSIRFIQSCNKKVR